MLNGPMISLSFCGMAQEVLSLVEPRFFDGKKIASLKNLEGWFGSESMR